MTIKETPWLLIGGEENHYYEKFKELFKKNNKILIPENKKEVIVYTNIDKNIYHIWRGGWYEWLNEANFNFNDSKYWRRAQRIWWIKYIIENPNIRNAFKDNKNNSICLVSWELEYTVVLQPIRDTHFILITWFHTFQPTRYYTDDRFEKFNF
jgi:hypothetical protein